MENDYIQIDDSEFDKEYWATRAYVPEDLRDSIRSADLLIIPL